MLRFCARAASRRRPELSVAAAIDEQRDVCLRVFEQLFIVPEAFTVGQIQRNRTHGEGTVSCRLPSRSRAAGDDPDLVKCVIGVDRLGKDLAHAAGRAGNDGDFFIL